MADVKMNWTNTKIKLGELKPWADNPRQSTKAQARKILKSFERFGQVQPVSIGPDNSVYDGHQRLSALMTIHGAEYEIDARQSEIALSDDERRALVISLHAGATGEWDWDKLSSWQPAEMMDAGFDADLLKEWKRDVSALDNFLKSEKPEPADVEPEIDRAEELRQKWGVELGQMWKLGDHRLICGDCTDAAVVERVMGGEKAVCVWTDPPYGVSYTGKTKDALKIENDGAEDLPKLLSNCFSTTDMYIEDGTPIYIAHPPGALQMVFNKCFIDIGWKFHETLVWVKDVMVMGHSDYHYKHEPIMYGWKGKNRKWYSGRDQVSVFNINRPKRNTEHPTMKPPELVQVMLQNSTIQDDIVYEPFSGSGTTIIACENLSRKCRAVEISPAYVAVALERWSQLTCKTPELLEV